MDKIKQIKIKKADGSLSDYIPIGADAQNIDFVNGKNLADKMNIIDNSIQDLHHDKLDVIREAVGEGKVTQATATEIIANYGNYEGKIIEFLANGDAPNKTVGFGFVMTSVSNDQFLIILNTDGTVTQFNKTYYEKHNFETYSYINEISDLDNFTIDQRGDAPYMASVQNAINRPFPQETGIKGIVCVVAYAIDQQIQLYKDIETNKNYYRIITGTADRHSFSVWNRSELVDVDKDLDRKVSVYFDNLDVQAEINIKLDNMAKNGTLQPLLELQYDELKKEINNKLDIQDSSINDNTNNINTLKNRMDEFTKLPDGSTTGDAELIDIRTGFLGTKSKTAGDSVRNNDQFLLNSINSAVSENNIVLKVDIPHVVSEYYQAIDMTLYKNQIINVKFNYIDFFDISSTYILGVIDNDGNQITNLASGNINQEAILIVPKNAKKFTVYIKGTAKTKGVMDCVLSFNKSLNDKIYDIKKDITDSINSAINENSLNLDFSIISKNLSENYVSNKIDMYLLKNQMFKIKLNCTDFFDSSAKYTIGIVNMSDKNVLGLATGGINEEINVKIPENGKKIIVYIDKKPLKIGNFKVDITFMNSLNDKISQIQDELNKKSSRFSNFSIIGDSYSTFENWLVDGNRAYYPNEPSNNVKKVTQTYWYMLGKELNMKLLKNNSYSGSLICNFKDETNSFINRLNKMSKVFEEKPDLILILGGLNDTWQSAPAGTVKYDNFSSEDLKTVAPAFSYLIQQLQLFNPTATIINIQVPNLRDSIKTAMDTICNHYSIHNIKLTEYTVQEGHPDIDGMVNIKNQLKTYINNI